jgi:hypothetical protein
MLRSWVAWSLLSCCVLVFLTTLRGQAVDLDDQAPPAEPALIAEEPLPPPESESRSLSSETNEPTFVNATESATPIAPTQRRFQYRLKVELRAAYDDNITLSETDPVDDYLFVIQPTISLGFGDITSHEGNYLGVDYSPSVHFYADHSNFNSLDHRARIEGRYRFSRLTIGLIQDIQSVESSDVDSSVNAGNIVTKSNIDIGGRERLNAFTTSVPISYDLSGKTSLTAGVYHTFTDYSNNLINSEVVSADFGFNYSYSPKLVFGLNATGGENFVDAPSPDETFEQLHARASYELTGKLRANAAVGVEFRQFGNDRGENVSPVFDIDLVYEPFDGTSVDLSANRQTLNSASLSNQDFNSTQLIVTLQQRFLQRVFANVSGGYQNHTYFSTVSGVSSTREDNYYFIAPGFDVRITNFFFAGLYYLHRQNDSSFNFFSFDENQFGARATFNF